MASVHIYKISALDILPFKEAWRSGGVPGCRLSSNGSYFSYDNSGAVPVGPYRLKNGTQKMGNTPQAFTRAGLAVAGGQLLVRLIKGNRAKPSAADLTATFGTAPSQMMGGGFMLIADGKALAKAEIASGQGVPPKNDVYQVEADRGYIAFANDAADALYLLVGLPGSHSPLALAGLVKGKFRQMGLFDGGGPFWFRDAKGECPAQNGRGETPFFALGMTGELLEKR